MGVNIRTEYWYGSKLNNEDYELIDNLNKRNEEGEWRLDIPKLKYDKYLTLKYSTYYSVDDPLGIGVEIGSLNWGEVIAADEIYFELTDEVKEAANKLLDELNISGERTIYVHTLMA